MKEKRSAIRFPIANVAQISANGLKDTAEVQVRDLSTDGMGCSGNQPYQKGDMIHVTLKLPTTPEGAQDETLIGRVAWIEKFEEEEKTGYAFGIQFRQMEKQNPRLYEYVKCLGEFFL